MLSSLLFILVSFAGTVIGALTGIGGGIVIKTFADFFSHDSVIVVSFYTTIVVFSMCLVSIGKQLKKGFDFDRPILVGISVGSLVGGYLGDFLLNQMVIILGEPRIKMIQAIMLFFTLLGLLIYTRMSAGHQRQGRKGAGKSLLLGLFLGIISIFLGIGGGPLNVSLLIIFFGYQMRQATVYSLATVFFSQISKLAGILLSPTEIPFEPRMLPFLVIVAILGGYLGTKLNQKMSTKGLENLYTILMLCLCGLSLYNIYHYYI